MDHFPINTRPAAERRELGQVARSLLEEQFSTRTAKGWDTENGGFPECLMSNGLSVAGTPRRIRVAAGQIFSFARGLEFGLVDAKLARD